MPSSLQIRAACRALRAGGLIAYPTEAVWGFGCEPFDADACSRLLTLKRRSWRKGLILIAADLEQLRPFIGPVPADKLQQAQSTWPGPATWLLPASADAPPWITGGRDSIAVRVTAHAAAHALCRAYGHAIVSTSANISTRQPAMSRTQVYARFGAEIDHVLAGDLGGLRTPTSIRDLMTGKLLRP